MVAEGGSVDLTLTPTNFPIAFPSGSEGRFIGCTTLPLYYLPIHIIFETFETVTVLKIWRVIPNELPSLRRVAP